MEEKVKKLVADWLWDNLELAINDLNWIYITWSCYILGNRKYLLGTAHSDHYFEVTYNEKKDEWYLDVYNKIDNKVYGSNK